MQIKFFSFFFMGVSNTLHLRSVRFITSVYSYIYLRLYVINLFFFFFLVFFISFEIVIIQLESKLRLIPQAVKNVYTYTLMYLKRPQISWLHKENRLVFCVCFFVNYQVILYKNRETFSSPHNSTKLHTTRTKTTKNNSCES